MFQTSQPDMSGIGQPPRRLSILRPHQQEGNILEASFLNKPNLRIQLVPIESTPTLQFEIAPERVDLHGREASVAHVL